MKVSSESDAIGIRFGTVSAESSGEDGTIVEKR
ncbi:hypothetical protein J2T20_004516 [Paenibacillus wynnii]|nr:hypothetical protein [Paenibacillus wynnii]